MNLTRRRATPEDVPRLLTLRHDTMGEHLIAAGEILDDARQLARVMDRFECAEVLMHDGVMVGLLTPFATCVHTLTTDNGREFAQHERIAKELDADFFFAHPYSSWERGANENMNGLIREFFPKKMRFDSITKKDISAAMHYLNHRPRKCLGFKTPHEVFWKKLHSHHNAVALQT